MQRASSRLKGDKGNTGGTGAAGAGVHMVGRNSAVTVHRDEAGNIRKIVSATRERSIFMDALGAKADAGLAAANIIKPRRSSATMLRDEAGNIKAVITARGVRSVTAPVYLPPPTAPFGGTADWEVWVTYGESLPAGFAAIGDTTKSLPFNVLMPNCGVQIIAGGFVSLVPFGSSTQTVAGDVLGETPDGGRIQAYCDRLKSVYGIDQNKTGKTIIALNIAQPGLTIAQCAASGVYAKVDAAFATLASLATAAGKTMSLRAYFGWTGYNATHDGTTGAQEKIDHLAYIAKLDASWTTATGLSEMPPVFVSILGSWLAVSGSPKPPDIAFAYGELADANPRISVSMYDGILDYNGRGPHVVADSERKHGFYEGDALFYQDANPGLKWRLPKCTSAVIKGGQIILGFADVMTAPLRLLANDPEVPFRPNFGINLTHADETTAETQSALPSLWGMTGTQIALTPTNTPAAGWRVWIGALNGDASGRLGGPNSNIFDSTEIPHSSHPITVARAMARPIKVVVT